MEAAAGLVMGFLGRVAGPEGDGMLLGAITGTDARRAVEKRLGRELPLIGT